MKSILMSIRPQHTCNILNDIKRWEIRKKFPKDYVGWVYIYCTKDKKYKNLINRGGFLTGMVVARFWCDKVEDYVYGHKWSWEQGAPMLGADNSYEKILKDTCLTDEELRAYVDDLCFSAIHITKLEIFDKPKEISEFMKTLDNFDGIDCWRCSKRHNCSFNRDKKCEKLKLTRAPQSYCFIEL